MNLDIDEIRGRAERAGPTVVDVAGMSAGEVEFLKWCRADIFALCNEVDRLRSEVERLTDELAAEDCPACRDGWTGLVP